MSKIREECILHIGSNMPYSKLCPQLFRLKIFDYIDLEYVILSTSNMKVPLSNARCQFHQYLVEILAKQKTLIFDWVRGLHNVIEQSDPIRSNIHAHFTRAFYEKLKY